jgi:hypothetical protein
MFLIMPADIAAEKKLERYLTQVLSIVITSAFGEAGYRSVTLHCMTRVLEEFRASTTRLGLSLTR